MAQRGKPSDDRRVQARQVIRSLERMYPDANCALVHKNPFQLLVATILSAQCTDVRVNLVTPALFARFPDAHAMALADRNEIEVLIRSTGFFRAKARNIRSMAVDLVERHGGEVPCDLQALTALAGVGRKTANVVLGTAFGIASGVVVDTHVKRLAGRMGLSTRKTPEQIERDLIEVIPASQWVNLSHRLIQHGRNVCLARRPRCSTCSIEPICPKKGTPPSR